MKSGTRAPRMYRPRRKQSRKSPSGVCLFHNDGVRLYAFPDTWQAAYDFLKSKDEFVIAFQTGQPVNATCWGRGFKGHVELTYRRDGQGVANVSFGNSAWGLNDLRIKPNSSVRIAYEGETPRAYWF